MSRAARGPLGGVEFRGGIIGTEYRCIGIRARVNGVEPGVVG